MKFEEVYTRFLEAKRAQRLSAHTLADYQNTYNKFVRFLENTLDGSDTDFAQITVRTISQFLASMDSVSKKTVLNYHTGLSSLWNWATQEGLCTENIVRRVTPPKAESREVIPFTRDEVSALLKAAEQSTLPERDKAILLFMLDTGVRASELGAIRLRDVDIQKHQVLVFGKGSKERRLMFSDATAEAILTYLATRGITKIRTHAHRNNYLFLGKTGTPLSRDTLRQLYERLADRCGVIHAHPHKMRHTFAIEFLRNGGNVYVLQALLGHSTLDMVKRYLTIVQRDLENAHNLASPVKHWFGKHKKSG